MLPVETIFPAGKQNSEIPHSSLKSRPQGDSVIEVCCEVFLSKKQQGRTGNSTTVESAETELLLHPATHQEDPLNCSAVKHCSTKLSYFWNFPYIQKTSSQKASTQHCIAGWSSLPSPLPRATWPWHHAGFNEHQKEAWMSLPNFMKMVSYYLKTLETLLLCEWFDPIARRNCFFGWGENLRVSHTVTSWVGHRDTSTPCSPAAPARHLCW